MLNPSGLCQCGCGQPAPVARTKERGYLRGESKRFIQHHHVRVQQPYKPRGPLPPKPNPNGLCLCGCGKPAPIADRTLRSLGWVRGEPTRFIRGHSGRGKHIPWGQHLWDEKDCGFATPCWVWNGGTDRLGYATFRKVPSHRFSYITAYGEIAAGLDVDHLCRNPSCVNPYHLEAVTHRENLRRGKGAKLNLERANAIRARYAKGGITYLELADENGVNMRTIWLLVTRRTWVN